ATANLENATAKSSVLNATVTEADWKIQVPGGMSSLKVAMTGPSCTSSSCPLEADLFVRLGSRPTDTAYDCRPRLTGNAESCSITNPAPGWYYIREAARSGAGTVKVKATFS